MSRGLSPAYVAALDTSFWREIIFVEMQLLSATLRMHSYVGDITWGGNTWSGVGTFGSIDVIEEGERTSPYALTLSLTGIDTTLAPEAIAGDLSDAPVIIYFGMLNEGAALITESGTATGGAASTVTLAASASPVSGFYIGMPVRIVSGTGSGSSGTITAYNGSTKVATVGTAWATAPANGSGYVVDVVPVEIWRGTVDVADIVASRKNGAISVTCESELADFNKSSGSLFSEADLQADYPGDEFFKYLPNMQDLVIEWKETRGASIGAGGGGARRPLIGSR